MIIMMPMTMIPNEDEVTSWEDKDKYKELAAAAAVVVVTFWGAARITITITITTIIIIINNNNNSKDGFLHHLLFSRYDLYEIVSYCI